jgi:UDP-N-acetylmuramate--alanine ligase
LDMSQFEDAIKLYPSKDIKNIEFILKDDEPYTTFDLLRLGKFEVWGFGEHIALDASLAILASMHEMGLDQIRENLSKYRGIKKRFDIVQKNDDFIIIDDYAHHPTEVKATIQSVQLYNKLKQLDKTTIVWQPHKYSRTRDNLESFKECFKGCDQLIILPVWTVAEEILEIDFKEEFKEYNLTLASNVKANNGYLEIIQDEKVIQKIDKGMVLGVGAGDITYQLRH